MSQDANAVAEVSSTPAQVEPIEVEDFNDEQRDAWERTGELPAKEIKPLSAESAPAKPGDANKIADAKEAESGTAKKANQDRNWRKLESERDTQKRRADELEARIKALEAGGKSDVKAESSAAPTEIPKAPEKPKRASFATDEEYEKAYERDYLPKKQAFDSASQAYEKHMEQINNRSAAMNAKWKGIKDKGEELYGKDEWQEASKSFEEFAIYAGDPMEVYIRESGPDIGAHFLQYMSLKPKDVQRITKLPLGEQWKELWAIEAAMRSELKLDGGQAVAPKFEEPKPKPKIISDALPPPREVGGQGAAAQDEEAAAIKRAREGDPGPWMDLQNRRELAKRKAGNR